MAVAAAQKNREMFAIKKSYSIEVGLDFVSCLNLVKITHTLLKNSRKILQKSGEECFKGRFINKLKFNLIL